MGPADDQAVGTLPSARDAIELLVEVLSAGGVDLDRERFYSRLAEGVSRIAGVRRVAIFCFDEVTRRVEAAGGHGISLDVFADLRVIAPSPLSSYLGRLLDFATRSRWGKRPIARVEALAS